MSAQPPSVILITTHDLGRFLGGYGVPSVRTPNLDRFAADAIRFDLAFCTAPQCSPSRSSIFTGRYPHCNGVMGLTHGEFGWDLYPEEQHLAQVLGRAGYATILAGIIHEARSAERCGFHEIIPPGHGEDVSDHALEVLRRIASQGRPFYLQLGYHEPHRVQGPTGNRAHYMGFVGDYIAPDSERGVTVPPYIHDDAEARQEMAELQGAVHYLDTAVGRFLDGLRALGIAEDALVVFTTDHGLALPRAKGSLYDPGIEIALMIRMPSRGWLGGRAISTLVSNVDLFPTVLETLGLPIGVAVQGHSLRPLLDGDVTSHRDHIFAEMTYHDYYHPLRGIRTDRYKLIVNFTTAPSFMDPSQSWYRRTRPVVPAIPAIAYTPPVELYDLHDDPLEWNNLASDPALSDVRRDLMARLYSWMRDTGDPLLQGAVTSPRHRQVVDMLTASGT